MFYISQASVADTPTIIDIANKSWWPTYSSILSEDQIRYMLATIYAPEKIQKDISTGAQTYLILKDGDVPKAFASYGLNPAEPAAYKLHKLYVLPANHKNGYGRALIQEVVDRARHHHIDTLDLNVNRFNPALKFYERLGFTALREEDIPVGPYWMNDYVLRMKL